MKSKIISLSAISAGLIAIVLSVGAYFEVADLFMMVVASVFVILPLYYNSFKGSLLTYLVGGVIAFVISGFNIYSLVFPVFFSFFGVYPIVRSFFTRKRLKKHWILIVGAVWCVFVFYGAYFYYMALIGDLLAGLPYWLVNNIIYFILGVALIFYFVFDRFTVLVQRVVYYYLNKIIK